MEKTTNPHTDGSVEGIDIEKQLVQCLVVKCSTYFYSTFIYIFYYYNYIVSSLNAGAILPTIVLSSQCATLWHRKADNIC